MKLPQSVTPFSIFLLTVSGFLYRVQAEEHHMDMSMDHNETETESIPIPCISDSQCQNETDGLGPLSFCDPNPMNRVCKCKDEIREIPIRQHHSLCVVPVRFEAACQNDHECGAGTHDSTCVKINRENEEIRICKCDSDLGLTYSKSMNACIPMRIPNPSPYRWWFVLLIIGYPAAMIGVSATRQRLFKWYRKNYTKKRKRRNSAGGTSVNTTSTDEEEDESEDEVEMGSIQ